MKMPRFEQEQYNQSAVTHDDDHLKGWAAYALGSTRFGRCAADR